MNLVDRSFVFEISTNWDIKNANRVPGREKLVPLHVSSTDFTLDFPTTPQFLLGWISS